MFYKLWWYKKQLEGFELEDIKDINTKKRRRRDIVILEVNQYVWKMPLLKINKYIPIHPL